MRTMGRARVGRGVKFFSCFSCIFEFSLKPGACWVKKESRPSRMRKNFLPVPLALELWLIVIVSMCYSSTKSSYLSLFMCQRVTHSQTPLRDIPSGCCFFTWPCTVTRSSLPRVSHCPSKDVMQATGHAALLPRCTIALLPLCEPHFPLSNPHRAIQSALLHVWCSLRCRRVHSTPPHRCVWPRTVYRDCVVNSGQTNSFGQLRVRCGAGMGTRTGPFLGGYPTKCSRQLSNLIRTVVLCPCVLHIDTCCQYACALHSALAPQRGMG